MESVLDVRNDRYEDYGCRLNAIDVNELFIRYEKAGFLYPQKLERLSPFLSVIIENWKKALSLGDEIIQIITYDNPLNARWGTVTNWRHIDKGWVSQHLVALGGGGMAAKAVMLAGQAVILRDSSSETADTRYDNHQNWFRRSNSFANKIFGTIQGSVGHQSSFVRDCAIFEVPLSATLAQAPTRVERVSASDVARWVERVRSPVYARAEGLLNSDLELSSLDETYRRAGLRRYRKVFAIRRRTGDLAGIALAYRGPLGLNFSFLENRCDLILDPDLEPTEFQETVELLLACVVPFYSDFELGWVPLVVDDRRCHDALIRAGGRLLREYAQGIWLSEGYAAWYRHVQACFAGARAQKREER